MPILFIIVALLAIWIVYPLYKNADPKKRRFIIGITIVLGLALLLFVKGLSIPAFAMTAGAFIITFIRSIVTGIIYGKIIEFFTGRVSSNTPANNTNQTTMSVSNALEIMDLEPPYSEEELIKKYHELMKQNHPDKGGSKFIAKQINLAKEVLLKELEQSKNVTDD